MIGVSLKDLLNYPRLVAWLAGRQWQADFPGDHLDTRKLTLNQLVLLDPEDEPGEEPDLSVGAEVRDLNGRSYRSTLEFFIDDEEPYVDFLVNCTCRDHFTCPHAALALETLSSIACKSTKGRAAVRDPILDTWLYQLRTAQERAAAADAPGKPAPQSTKFLAYCIELPHETRHREQAHLCLRIGSRDKHGHVNIGKAHASADPLNPPGYMTREDIPICAAFHARRNRLRIWGAELPLGGPDWDELLDAALATGRLFLVKPAATARSVVTYEALDAGPPLPVDPGWQVLENESAKPVLALPSPELLVLPTHPLRYIDPGKHLIGVLQSEMPPEILALWADGPSISADRIPDVNVELRAIPTPAPLPTPAEKPAEALTGLSPTPVLHITWVHVGIFQKRHIGGLVKFQYPGCPPVHPLAADAPPQTSWIEGDKRLILIRDAAQEQAFLQQLPQSGLLPIHAFYQEQELNDKNRHSVMLGDLRANTADWLEFLSDERAERLRAAGWTIDGDPRLGLVIHDLADFFPTIESDAGHGIDWFRFDVQGEFDGKRISLIPQIARAIEEDWLERYREPAPVPEHLLIACDDPADGHIRFPARRFLDMLEQVRHLFVGHENDKSLRLDRLSAAGIADALAIDSGETTRALAALGRNLRDIQGLPPAELPATIHAELRPYQTDGFRWLQFLAAHGLHGILADDMGLGKTLQTLAHLAAETAKSAVQPSLVIAPTSVVPNWVAEAEKFAPSLKVLVLHGGDRADHFDKIPAADLVFTTYPLLVRDYEELAKHQWRTLVLDEAQYIKNPKSATAQCACRLKAAHRLCLSGTPMENHLGELWSLMRFLMPGFLGDEKSFNNHLRKPIERDHSGDAQAALNRRVSPLILRRTKDQVAAELPEKTILIHGIDLTPQQTDLYESVRAAMDRRVRDAIAEKGLNKSHIIVLDALLKLRQICCHPQLLDSEAARRVTESAKLDFLAHELLPTLIEEGRRILLFSQFTSMLELIEEHLELADIPFLKLTGQTRERAQLVKKFQSGTVPVFLISLKAGGTGLNLTAADTVIHYDPWWNPAAENQATDRAHRIGQNKPVFVHKLVCRGTIEERIVELQKHKAALVEALLSEETGKLRIDSETLSHLLAPVAAAAG